MSIENQRSSLYRRVLDRIFPDRTLEGITPPFLKPLLDADCEDRRVPDRRLRVGTLPGGRRAADRLRDGFVNRSPIDRRKEPRYIPIHRRAYVSWWQGPVYRTAEARIENLSRSGAAALLAEIPADVGMVWVCFVDAPHRGWYPASVVGMGNNNAGAERVRVALTHPLPFCVFTAVVWGAPKTAAPGSDFTTKLVAPPPGAPTADDRPAERHVVGKVRIPERIAQYHILECLGSGGMGQVYLAEDTELQRRVALKLMHPHLARDPSGRIRFLREARAAAAIQHDNIVTIFQVGQHDDIPFLAMQLLEGQTLAGWLDQVRPTLADVLRIGEEIAGGLAAAHRAGLIHRDIKPDNIWLEARDQRVKLLDFGLARNTTQAPDLTHSGYILGTPAYMSPEQAMNEPCDHRSDLFSLGTVLYRLCGHELPFGGKSTFAILSAVTRHAPRPLEELNPDTPPELAALISRLLAKRPEDRPEDAAAVQASLRCIAAALKATPVRAAEVALATV